MFRIGISLMLGVASLVAGPVAPGWADSQSRTCQTMNGWMICLSGSNRSASISLSCRSVNGHALCSGSGGLRCESNGGRPVCRGGDDLNLEIYPVSRTGMASPVPDIDLEEDD